MRPCDSPDYGATPWPQMVVGNVRVDLVDLNLVLDLISESLSMGSPLAVVSANLQHIQYFSHDGEWGSRSSAAAVSGPTDSLRWLTLLDGMPLVRRSEAISGTPWPKLSGSDLLKVVLESAEGRGIRFGILGGESATHMRLREVFRKQYPGVVLAGAWAPTRAELDDQVVSQRIAEEISEARVQILVVSLGKPRQEEWISRFGLATGARVFLAFGAAVDFLAGRISRAPDIVVKLGGEWAWRLMLEPRRLGRRYLIHGPPAFLRLRSGTEVVYPSVSIVEDSSSLPRFVGLDGFAEICAVVVTHNNARDIDRLIGSLRWASQQFSVRVVVVDNDSHDDTVKKLRYHDDVVIVDSAANLGYAGGINRALQIVGRCRYILILNPDLVIEAKALGQMLEGAAQNNIGAVVPLILNQDGSRYCCIRREPSIGRAIVDAVQGSKLKIFPKSWSEIDTRPRSYADAHEVDWATGAALLVPYEVASAVGDWNESFFLYSEETDYFRRIRAAGWKVLFQPRAIVQHRGGGSGGNSVELTCLRVVNRVRYIDQNHSRLYAALFRLVVVIAQAVRSKKLADRRALFYLLHRRQWRELPHASLSSRQLSGQPRRGSVIVPACNEAAVIARTLRPLSHAASAGFFELIVVCNGCTDSTADVARSIDGVKVIELNEGSKPAALNAGDTAATLWPRLYLDADIQITAASVLAVLDRLTEQDVMAARPDYEHDLSRSSVWVRGYYRARNRIPRCQTSLWGAGAYGLSEAGHKRFGEFPLITGDDLYVDSLFSHFEKAVVATEPSIVTPPTRLGSLLAILRRSHRGEVELSSEAARPLRTARAVLSSIRGPKSGFDAAIYLGMALARRCSRQASVAWERDESSRRVL